MSALSDDYQRDRRPPGPVIYTVKNDEIIYTGALCCTDANGELLAGTDASGNVFAGVNYGARVDNSDDGETCAVDKRQVFKAAGTGFAAGDVGKSVYLSNDNTVALSTTYSVYVGKIVGYISSTEVWVDPTVGDDDLNAATATVADPASATSTNALFTSIASLVASAPTLSRTNGRFTSIASLVASAPTLSRTDGRFTSLASVDLASAITSASFSATPTSAELAAFAALCGSVASVVPAALTEAEVLGDDVTAVTSVQASHVAALASALTEAEVLGDDVTAVTAVQASHVTALASALAEAEKAADDARAGRTGAAAAITALKTLGLFV